MMAMRPLTVLLYLLFLCTPFAAAAPAQPSEWILPAVTAPQVQQHTFASTAAKTRISYFIYTPEIYDAEPQRLFPMMYWLHGIGGGIEGIPRLVEHFDSAIAAG